MAWLRRGLARASLVLLPCAVLAASAGEREGGAAEAAALAADDECGAGSPEQCSLNALQLRGRQALATGSDADENMTAAIVLEARLLATGGLDADYEAMGGPDYDFNETLEEARGSCAAFGCVGYNQAHSCQCNSQCVRHHSCCADYQSKCSHGHGGSSTHSHGDFYHGRIITGYHQTSVSAGHAILKSGFRPGHIGYCGGGIYFADNPWATNGKAVGPESHKGFMIEAKVDLGRSKVMGSYCMSPTIYAATLSHAPAAQYLAQNHVDSFIFNPYDGTEYVIADPRRVISMKQYTGRW